MKRVGPSLYVHRTALDELPHAGTVRSIGEDGWSVVRVDVRRGRPIAIMFGWTTDWEVDPHPRLLRSVLYKLEGDEWVPRSPRLYTDCPIYHRKESMLPKGHPRRAEYEALTAQEDAAGLLGRRDIGRESQWAHALATSGHRLVGHCLVATRKPPELPTASR